MSGCLSAMSHDLHGSIGSVREGGGRGGSQEAQANIPGERDGQEEERGLGQP